MLLLRIYMNLQAGGWSIILLSREHGTHQNVTINNLVTAGFRGWSSLMMRAEDEDSTKGNERFSRQRNVIQTKGFRIKSIISSQMDALTVADTEIRKFLLPDPIFDKFEQQRRA
ncbi:Acid phosphatase 1 [Spatholobus suberectus]|nr:Acid phosphatase 1 [Spatholobus suberectus]